MNKLNSKLFVFVASLMLGGAAGATDFSFTGTFTQDDDVQTFGFSVGATSSVTLRTWSYAGGVNAAGATIARGGFDPILALFNSSGTTIAQNDDGGSLVAADGIRNSTGSGARWDTFLTSSLAAGTYSVSVQQYNNFAGLTNAPSAYARFGDGNFTPALAGPSCIALQFCDVSGSTFNERDSHWAFDILNVETAVIGVVPEPETYAMLLAGLGLMGFVARRRKQQLAAA